MLKKSLLSLAVTASVVGLSGCNISSTTDNANNVPKVQQQNQAVEDARGVSPVFNPANKKLPVGIDFIFGALASATVPDSMKDGTAHTASAGTSGQSPVTDALDILDGGISTLAPIDIPMSGSIDPASIVAGTNVRLIKLPNGQDMVDQGLILPTVGDVTVATDVDALDLATIGALFATTKADGSPADDSAFAAQTGAPESVAAMNLFGAGFNATTSGILFMQPKATGGDPDYSVSVLSLDGGTNNTIRIKPLKPLSPKTKYIVMITGGVDAADGTPVEASTDYSFLKGTTELYTPALQGVRDSIGGWEQMAGAIVTVGGSNTAALADGIALTAGFTTVDPTAVLKSLAYPGYWAESAVALNNVTVAQATIDAAVPDSISAAEVTGIKGAAAGYGLTADEQTIFAAGYIVSQAISPAASAAYESPRNRGYKLIDTVTFSASYTGHQIPLSLLVPSIPATLKPNQVLISQGAIELPQYSKALSVDPASSWEANTAVGQVLDTLAGKDLGTTPPSDIDGSYNVTYRYPFAKEQRDAVVPLLFIEPLNTADKVAFGAIGGAQAVTAGAANCDRANGVAGKWPVTIFQHGFTVHRAGALLMGTQLARETCSVVVAMDLPHHGIAPQSSDRNGADVDNSTLPLTVTYNADTAASAPYAAAVNTIVAGDPDSLLANIAERHEGLYLDATNTTQVMTYGDTKAGKSGDYFIRLDNFARTRDNSRQAVMDLLNLNATLATIDIDGDGTPDLDVTNVNYVGHSLGGIVGTTFLAVNNDVRVQAASAIAGGSLPKIQRAVLATPGGGLTKLLENSVSISPKILGGLSVAANIQPGDANFESFMRVLQSTVDSADPMNFVSDLAAGASSATPTLLIEMIGGGTIAASDKDADLDGDADADGDGDNVDSGLPDALIALGTYTADSVVPNNTDSATNETAKMPLAGTDPMVTLLGSTQINATAVGQNYPQTKFVQGTHGTYSSADAAGAFSEMVGQSASFLTTGNTLVTTPALLEAP